MKKILFILIVFISYYAHSQGQANNWYFGYGAGINFTNGAAPTNISSSSLAMDTEEGCSTFSDNDGNLLFYSDGKTVWNTNNNPMPNGENLLGNSSSTQSAMIIPKPGSSSEYYIFTVGTYFNNSVPGFNYYTIDMNADAGLGDVVAGPVDLSQGQDTDWTEKVAAVKGEECDTYWVISFVYNSFYVYKITSSGVETSPVLSFVSTIATDRRGYLKVSPDGKKIAMAYYLYTGENPIGDSSIYLYDFNDLTGEITNETRIFNDPTDVNHAYGLEFSRQSTKLYASTFDGSNNKVYQYDMESSNIPQSEILIHSQIGYRGALQLGPNGKIYATVPVSYFIGTKYLDVINNPEADGVLCNYEEDVINLGSGTATQGLPPFFSSIFSPIEIVGDNGRGDINVLNDQLVDLCIGDTLTVTPEPLQGTITYDWIFNGVTISNIETLVINDIGDADLGVYQLEVTSVDICGITSFKEGFFTISSVNPPPVANPADSQIVCDEEYDGTYFFDFDALYTSEILNGQDPSVFEVLYFDTQDDADENVNPLPNPYDSPSTTIYARIQNINNNGCYNTTSFDINIYEAALPLESTAIENLSLCDNNSVGSDTDGIIVFDLTQRETEIMNGQSKTNFTLTYFSDASYTLSSQILNSESFINSSPGGQIIYVQMTNNVESSCFTNTSFVIEVFELPIIQSSMLFKNCDEDGNPDGFTDFNLDEANETITNDDTSLTVTYHLSMADADASSNAVPPSPFNNATASTVFARVENSDGCHRVSTVELQVSTTAFPNGYLQELQSCDDDDTIDGLHLFDLSETSADMIDQFPSGQNLRVQFYRNLSDAQLEQNEIIPQDAYVNGTPFNQTIYVRVESDDNGECFGIGPHLTLTVHPRPEFEVEPIAIVCIGVSPITIETFNPKDTYTYQWTDENGNIIGNESSLTVTTGGTYTVIATSGSNCESFPHPVIVSESIKADIGLDDVTIVDDSANNTITINNDNNNLGVGDYEFALDDEFGIYQDESYFDMVLPGLHTIYVRDKNNCGISQLEVPVIGFPKFFTPNNDGWNDYWKVLGINENFYSTSLIHIFDRYGKIVSKIDPISDGWNGYYNGQMLPATDYWFSVQLIDNDGNTEERKGHFSLIRR